MSFASKAMPTGSTFRADLDPGKLPRLAVVDERRKAGGAAFCAASPDYRKRAAFAYELALGGSYNIPEGARSILEIDDGRGSLFLDFPSLPGGGRLLLATLDPHSHNGQRFMPATTRFIQSFYPWLNRQLGIVRPVRNRFTYLQCSHQPSEWHPERIEESLGLAGFETVFAPCDQLGPDMLARTDPLYIPSSHDEFFIKSRAETYSPSWSAAEI